MNMKGGDHTQVQTADAIEAGMELGKSAHVRARGNPADIVALGIAVAITVVAAGIAYYLSEGGEKAKIGPLG